MCFVLYVGTEKSLMRKKWDKDVPDLCIESLSENDSIIKTHFTKQEIQYVGSTSGCGCDFPHVILQNGEWPVFEDPEDDQERKAKNRYNREKLMLLLKSTGEEFVEIYGIWDGDYDKEPKAKESIQLMEILDNNFFFKEQGFYIVKIL
jgi:hypothetical protein